MGILVAILISFTPGLIQSSHFGTTESLLTLLYLLIVAISLAIIDTQPGKSISRLLIGMLGFVFGLSAGIKLSSVYFIFPAAASLLWYLRSISSRRIREYTCTCIIIICSMALAYGVSSPYNIIDSGSFIGSMRDETSVANGLDVFYTRQFTDTGPYYFFIY